MTLESRLEYYRSLAEQTSVYNTETGEGDPTVLESFKCFSLEKAKIVLRSDRRNGPARRVAKWAVSQEFHEPDFHSLAIVWQQAGFENYHLIFNPSKT